MNYCYWLRGKEHTDMARLSIESVRSVDRIARIAIVTDEPDTTPEIAGVQRIELAPGRPVMVANLDAQIAYLSCLWAGTAVMFLDADILLRKPFDAFTTDVVATWRDHTGYSDGEKQTGMASIMPYNYGVLGFRAGPVALEILIWLRARILKMSAQYQNWYANQMALAELLGKRPDSGIEVRDCAIRWTPMDFGTPFTAALLPCDTFNYSPESDSEDVSGKHVLHLKGARKAWMSAYAKAA